jgi:hypothetical protein
MGKNEVCPCCKQPLPSQERAGVYMPPQKAKIFDAVRKFPGLTADELNSKCFGGSTGKNTVRQHIKQINDLLESTDIRISGKQPGMFGHYHIIKRKGQPNATAISSLPRSPLPV